MYRNFPYTKILTKNKKGLLEDVRFDHGTESLIENLCRKTLKKEIELEVELSTYIRYMHPSKIKPRVDKLFTSRELEMLFEYVSNSGNIEMSLSDINVLAEDYDEEECRHLVNSLLGYKLSLDYQGEHKNDGQLVEYTLTLESPSGKITIIDTEMCLMAGWNNLKDTYIA